MGRHSAPDTATARTGSGFESMRRNPWRIGLLIFLAVALIATVVGAFVLWPRTATEDNTSPEFSSTFALNQPQVSGTVVETDNNACTSEATGTVFDEPPLLQPAADQPYCERALVELTSGENAGRMTQLVHYGVAGEPTLAVGEDILLSEATTETGDVSYSFADYERTGHLLIWAVIVALAIIAFAAWTGVRSLLGLGISLGIVFVFLVPGLIEGTNPLWLAIVACAAIILIVVPIVHGINWKSASTLGGSLIALGVAAFLASTAISSSYLQGLSGEENLRLLLYLPNVSVVGVLLCGFVIGALGGLNDVAISQASTVNELSNLDPQARPTTLFWSAMKVGRDHISSMVYTLVLTYTGASLPLLLLIAAASQPASHMLTSDIVATELLRSGVGALALTLTVPITTLIAAFTVPDHLPPKVIESTSPTAPDQPES